MHAKITIAPVLKAALETRGNTFSMGNLMPGQSDFIPDFQFIKCYGDDKKRTPI